jgi:hypothetical protein
LEKTVETTFCPCVKAVDVNITAQLLKRDRVWFIPFSILFNLSWSKLAWLFRLNHFDLLRFTLVNNRVLLGRGHDLLRLFFGASFQQVLRLAVEVTL